MGTQLSEKGTRQNGATPVYHPHGLVDHCRCKQRGCGQEALMLRDSADHGDGCRSKCHAHGDCDYDEATLRNLGWILSHGL